MEMTAKGYLDNLISVRDNLPIQVAQIIYKNENEIIDLNKEDQLFNKGIMLDGSILGLYSNTYSGTGRGFPKQKNSRYNFLNTGSLFNSFNIISNGFEVEIQNNDSKVGLLESLVEGEFIGLTEENQKKLNYEIIYPEILEYVNKYL